MKTLRFDGRKMAAIRKARRPTLSRVALAKAVGCHPTEILFLETGARHPRFDLVMRLVTVLRPFDGLKGLEDLTSLDDEDFPGLTTQPLLPPDKSDRPTAAPTPRAPRTAKPRTKAVGPRPASAPRNTPNDGQKAAEAPGMAAPAPSERRPDPAASLPEVTDPDELLAGRRYMTIRGDEILILSVGEPIQAQPVRGSSRHVFNLAETVRLYGPLPEWSEDAQP